MDARLLRRVPTSATSLEPQLLDRRQRCWRRVVSRFLWRRQTPRSCARAARLLGVGQLRMAMPRPSWIKAARPAVAAVLRGQPWSFDAAPLTAGVALWSLGCVSLKGGSPLFPRLIPEGRALMRDRGTGFDPGGHQHSARRSTPGSAAANRYTRWPFAAQRAGASGSPIAVPPRKPSRVAPAQEFAIGAETLPERRCSATGSGEARSHPLDPVDRAPDRGSGH